jgi:hypothetical protein
MGKISQYGDVIEPKLSDKLIGTSVGFSEDGELKDPTYNFTLQQLLSLFLPNIPSNTLQGVLDYGNTATQDINLIGTITTTELEVTNIANLYKTHFLEEAYIEGLLFDSLDSSGTIGQVLSNTGNGVKWITPIIFTPTLQQVLQEGNTADIDIVLDADIDANNIDAKTITLSEGLYVEARLFDSSNSSGTNGQVLISLGSSVEWQDFPLYVATSPLSINPATKTISIQKADGTQNGYLSYTDWINFDAKQNPITVTTLGNSGPSTLVGNTLNIPIYASEGLMGLTVSSPLQITAGDTPNISILQASSLLSGYLSATDWNTFNSKQNAITPAALTKVDDVNVTLALGGNPSVSLLQGVSLTLGWTGTLANSRIASASIWNAKQDAITLTTTGTSGAATFIGNTLNIPQYTPDLSGYVPISRTLSINGVNYDLSANRSWNVGTVVSVGALTLGTTGTDLSSTVANPTTTPVITLNVPTASSVNRGVLSPADWIAFNNKQPAGNYITSLIGEASATGPGAASVTLNNGSVIAKVLTGLNITGGSVVSTDTILTAFGKIQNQINGLIGGSIYQGTWNANTNTPALASGVGTKGYYYIVSVAGNTNLDGFDDWNIGDWAIFDGTAWQQVDNTDAVVSVNGQVGIVNLTTDNIPQGVTNLYFANSLARAALSFTPGSGAYNNTTGVITIPTNTNQLTNGASFITLASLSTLSPLSYNSGTGAFSIVQANGSTNGYLSSTDWNTFNNKQGALTLTTVGTSGAATLVGTTLNIPNYAPDLSGFVPYTGATANLDLGTNTLLAKNLVINHSSGSGVAASITKNGSGEALTVVKGSGSGNAASITGGITLLTTLNLTNALADSFIASASTWNAKQNAITLTTTGTSGAATLVGATLNIPQYQSALTNPITGTGTTNYLPKFTGTTTIGNSIIFDNGTNVGIGTTSPLSTLTVSGNLSLFTTNQIRLHNSAKNNWTQVDSPLLSGDSEVDFRVLTKTGTFYINASGNVGIGTTSPSQLLQIGNGTGINSQYLRLFSAQADIYIGQSGGAILGQPANQSGLIVSDNVTWPLAIGTTAAQPLIFGTSNAERMRITASGNVGIGTTSPTTKLTIDNSANANTNHIDMVGYSSTAKGHLGYFGNATYLSSNYFYAGGQNADTSSLGQVAIVLGANTTNTSYIDFNLSDAGNVSPTNKMRITSSGNVGIGTTSPQGILEAVGVSYFTRSGQSFLVNPNYAGANTHLQLQAVGNMGIAFATNGDNERLRITSTGNVGIGTSAPSEKLDVNGAIKTSSLLVIGSNIYSGIGSQISGAFGVNDYVFANYAATGNMIMVTNAAERMRITASGNVGIGTTSPNLKLSVLGSNGAPNSSGTTQNGVLRLSGGTGIYNVLDFGINETNDYSWIQSTRANNLAVYDKLALNPLGGNVGIGTTAPTERLHVNGNIRTANLTSGTTSSGFKIGQITSGGPTVINKLEIEIDGVTYYIPASIGTVF